MIGKKKRDNGGSAKRDDIEDMMSDMLARVQSSVPDKEETGDTVSAIRQCFEDNEWTYDYDEEKNIFTTNFNGKDVSYRIILAPRPKSIWVAGRLEMDAIPERHQELVWKVNEINMGIRYGAFFVDPDNDSIVYRCTQRFDENLPSSLVDSFFGMILDTLDDFSGSLKEIAEAPVRKKDSNPMFN